MNTKKITALALAALMAAGSTATSFAVNNVVDAGNDLSNDRPLTFKDMNIYEEDDGVLKKSNDFRPGDTLYIRLDELSTTDKKVEDEKDDMKVYADWKVGKDAVKSIDIVYRKGESVTTGSVVPGSKYYTVNIGGKELKVVVGKGETPNAAIKRVLRDEMKKDANFLKDERAAELKSYEAPVYVHSDVKYTSAKEALEAAGWTYGTFYAHSNKAYENADVVNLLKAAGGNNADATNKFYNAAEDKAAGFGTYLDSDTNSQGALPATCYLFTNGTKFVDSDVITTVEKLMGTNVVADIEKKENVFKKDNQLLAERDALAAESTVSVIKGYVKDGTILTEEEAKNAVIEKIAADEATDLAPAARAVINSTIDSVADPDFTYWVEIKTKDNDTTKVLDLAGVLRIGSTKNKAEKVDNQFQLDTSLDNRVYDSNNTYVEVDDEWTFEPDSRSVVKFDKDAEDVVLYFGENEAAWYEFDARGQDALNLEFTFDFNKEIADLFPKANIDFLTFTSNPATNRTGDLYITADEDTFLYEVTEDGVKEIKGAEYNEEEGAWHIRTRKLGAYAISDIELDTSVKVEGKDEASSNSSTSSKPNGDKHNPDTGR